MRKVNLIIIFILFNNFIFVNLQSQINNTIVVKVGNSLITSLDVQNEIITNLIINNQELTQNNINNNKNYAIKNLISKSIKSSEIKKYKIKNYNKKDLQNYIENVAKNLNINQSGLKEIFKQSNIDYKTFVEKFEIELLWNTLIFKIYRNQININIVDVDTEIKNFKESKSEEEFKEFKKNILNRKKEEKLNLFSRSHFSNLENSVTINFQ
tara:strand:+ start:4580 stop:5212 length:633 start_codon:yes stop_codon:yes gene_type:complete